VALLFSTRCGAQLSFWASFCALALHTCLAAGFGAAISQALPLWVLHFATAAVFGLLAVDYSYAYCQAEADADALEVRASEARETLSGRGCDIEVSGERRPLLVVWEGNRTKAIVWQPAQERQFWQVFGAVFVAEWGDRTQIAMCSLHSSLAIVPVVFGSLTAFALLSLTAVLVATMLKGRKLSERLINGLSALSFMVFALLALNSGIQACNRGHAA